MSKHHFMNSWYTINLGDPTLAEESLTQIAELFATIYDETAQEHEVAVFSRHELAGGLHCQLMLYCSPAAEKLAQKLAAQACLKPSPDDLSLLLGTDRALSLLFPTLDEDSQP